MKIWHISDTHGYHDLLTIPDNIDLVVHSGDACNYFKPLSNLEEHKNFEHWFANLPIEHKLYVPGNHDSAIAANLVSRADLLAKNIHLLIDESIEINGIKFYGTPYTPLFNTWHFMKPRHKMQQVWDKVPLETNILITHGPPKGILDLSKDHLHNIEQCGDKCLLNWINSATAYSNELTHVLFGHIHDNDGFMNYGLLERNGIVYSNASLVEDGKFGLMPHKGHVFEI